MKTLFCLSLALLLQGCTTVMVHELGSDLSNKSFHVKSNQVRHAAITKGGDLNICFSGTESRGNGKREGEFSVRIPWSAVVSAPPEESSQGTYSTIETNRFYSRGCQRLKEANQIPVISPPPDVKKAYLKDYIAHLDSLHSETAIGERPYMTGLLSYSQSGKKHFVVISEPSGTYKSILGIGVMAIAYPIAFVVDVATSPIQLPFLYVSHKNRDWR